MISVLKTAIRTNAIADLGEMLRYPDEETVRRAGQWLRTNAQYYPKAVEHLSRFFDQAAMLSLEKLQEVYTRTFDLAPICIPYITAHIYGDENYQRGELMTRLNDRYNTVAFPIEGELPDHLGLMLRFCPHLDADELDELIEFCLRAPVQSMCANLKDQDNPYYELLKAVEVTLEH